MLIKSIEFKNFRQFKDSRFSFSIDPKKNVTVILGDNTHGKTTIVRGFLWCLYRDNQFVDKTLLNEDIAGALIPGRSSDVKVMVEIEHGDYDYIITTKETYVRSPSTEAIMVSNKATTNVLKTPIKGGNTQPLYGDAATVEIEKILRRELAPYFFFDGESNKIDDVSAKSNLNEAIVDILGMRKKEQLLSYFDTRYSDNVINRFNNKLVLKDDALNSSLSDRLEEARDKYQSNEDELKEIEEQLDKLEAQLKEKEDELDSIKDVIADQEEKKGVKEKLERTRSARDDNFQSMLFLLNKNDSLFKYLLAYSFKNNNIKDIYQNSSYADNKDALSNIEEKAIDEIIERGYCICGAKILKGNDAYQHLLHQKNFIAPKNYGKAVSDFISFGEDNIDYSNINFAQNVIDKAENVSNAIEKIETYKERLKQIEARIVGKKDAGQIQQDIINIRVQIGNFKGRKSVLNENQVELNERIEQLNYQIAKNAAATKDNDKVNRCLAYAEYIESYFKKRIAEQKTEIRAELEKRVQETFDEMYTGSRQVCIDESFRVSTKLLYGSKNKLDESKGLETVKNFAFVGGLISLAKEQLNNGDEDDDVIEDEAYPLVMDAPFSNCDETHIERICKKLPTLCNQVIIIVMKKDFKNSDAVISDRIGKKYEIVKESESYAYAEEE